MSFAGMEFFVSTVSMALYASMQEQVPAWSAAVLPNLVTG